MTFESYLATLRGKQVAVIGIGVSNIPLIKLFLKKGIAVTACDKCRREAYDNQSLLLELEALGATRLQAFTTAVFPQVLPTYLSVSLFCLEGNVRYASILGYVGAGGLGLIMNEKIGCVSMTALA